MTVGIRTPPRMPPCTRRPRQVCVCVFSCVCVCSCVRCVLCVVCCVLCVCSCRPCRVSLTGVTVFRVHVWQQKGVFTVLATVVASTDEVMSRASATVRANVPSVARQRELVLRGVTRTPPRCGDCVLCGGYTVAVAQRRVSQEHGCTCSGRPFQIPAAPPTRGKE